MSNRPLDITQRQAQALLRAAESEKGVVEVKLGETFVRLIPAVLVQETARLDADTIGLENKGPKRWA